MKPRFFFYAIGILMVAFIFRAAAADAHRLSGHPRTVEGKLRLAKRQVTHDRATLAALQARHWKLMSPQPAVAVMHRIWLRRDRAYVRQLERFVVPSWLVRAFICIHRGEGAWNANTGNGYYGGLQMDYGFMGTYGRGLLYPNWPSLKPTVTADRWTPAQQIGVAIRAYYSGRGFYPWPTTARNCGLI